MASYLSHQLTLKENELLNITKEHNELKLKFNNLEKDYNDIKTTCYLSIKSEKASKVYLDIIENLEKEIRKLKDESSEKEKVHLQSQLNMQLKFEKEINQTKKNPILHGKSVIQCVH